MTRDSRTYVPLAARLADFGGRDGCTGGAARTMGRVLREGARVDAEQARSLLARALRQPHETGAAPAMRHGPPDSPAPATALPGETPSEEAEAVAPEPDLQAHLAAAREEGFAAGVEEGMARARAEAETRIAALEQAHAEALAARERLWADRLAAELAARLQEGFRHLAGQLEAAVADVLAPLVQEAMREQALADLAATIAALAEEGLHVRVRGPAILVEALKARLPACPFEAEADEALADLRVHLADAVIETRLGEWQARLTEAMAVATAATSLPPAATVDRRKSDGETVS